MGITIVAIHSTAILAPCFDSRGANLRIVNSLLLTESNVRCPLHYFAVRNERNIGQFYVMLRNLKEERHVTVKWYFKAGVNATFY
jgi:hypothetical protein